ncbi:MAG: DUF1080 domain-containing protein [Planctomycetaceae bacterium]
MSKWSLAAWLFGLMLLPVAPSLGQEFKLEPGFTLLFDGQSLKGWEGDAQTFRIEKGEIVAGSLEKRIPRNEFLCTRAEFGDFELRLQAKLLGEGKNAGVQFRSRRVPNDHEVSGYQCDIGTMGDRLIWGSLYDESRRNRFLMQGPAEAVKRAVVENDWNNLVIRCQGPRVQLWVNDVATVDYTESDPQVARAGLIGLQIHGGAPAEARYRHLRIKPLPAE